MRSLSLLLLICTVTLVTAPAHAHAQAPAPAAAAAVTQVADAFVAASIERNPEMATFLGLPGAQHNRIFENSEEARRAWDQRVDALYARFRTLDARAVAGRPEAVTYGFLQQALESEVGRRVCRTELWQVDHLNGFQVNIPPLLTRQPVTTAADRAAALERLRQYPRFIDQEIATLRRGLASGYSAPRVNVERVMAQIEALAADAATSPFADPGRRSGDAVFNRAVSDVVAREINPALSRYRSFLGEYLATARTAVGVSALPQGEACYRALMRDNTSLDLAPDDVHQLGLTLMTQIHAEVATIGARSFGTSDVPALLERLRSDPSLRFQTADQIMAVSQAALNRARAAMPRFFGRVPRADVVLQPFAEFEAPSMPVAMYRPSPLDGSKPGLYMVNLHKPQETPRADVEAVAFHEAIPGHHLQIALSFEQPGAHPITQIFWSTAFVEGWGLYSERLADEMGLYSGDLDRLGMLSAAAWRAARLVVDTGLHAKQWTREQAVDYMRRNTASGVNSIQTEVDRYIIMPGQALAYMIGYREIMAQRQKAQMALGARFDIRAFHDAALGRGGVTLPMLREQIDEWIRAR